MPELTIDFLLAHACPAHNLEDGWSVYYVELHCIVVTVVARKVKDGAMDQETGQWVQVPRYEVRNYSWSDS